METVVGECAQFETEAQRICGDFMNVSNLLEQENEQEAHLHVLVSSEFSLVLNCKLCFILSGSFTVILL